MKEDLITFWEKLGFEDGKGPSDVGTSMQKWRIINTQSIVNTFDTLERKELFGENGKSISILAFDIPSLFANCRYFSADTTASVKNLFRRKKARGTTYVLQTPPLKGQRLSCSKWMVVKLR